MDFTPYLGLIRDPTCFSAKPESIVNEPQTHLIDVSDIPELSLTRLNSERIWERLNLARTGASIDLDADLKAFLATHFPVRSLYSGLLGNSSFTMFPPSTSQQKALPLHMRYQNGGSLLIRSLGLILSDTVTDQVIGLYEQGGDTAKQTITIPTINARTSTQTTLPKPWAIPMDGKRYELRTTLPDGVKVADNNLSCGCTSMAAVPKLLADCCAGKANGFMLTIHGSCSYDPLLIQLMDNDRTKLVIAYMLAYQSAYRLAMAPLSGQVERATVLSDSDLKDAARACRQEYLNRLGWLKKEVPKLGLSADNACFQTVATNGWSRSGIFR